MSVIVARPPNFELILKAFPDADKPGVIFAYGDNIYNPSGDPIPPALLAHERIHLGRQKMLAPPSSLSIDAAADHWWIRYVLDAEFRYREELLAHVAEFKAQDNRGLDRNLRAKILQKTAARLCAPLYNYTPPRSMTLAMRDIRWELEKK